MNNLNYTGEVIVESVWIRETPSLSGNPIRMIYKGDQFKLTEQSGNWFKCSIGWICSKLDSGKRLLKICNNNISSKANETKKIIKNL